MVSSFQKMQPFRGIPLLLFLRLAMQEPRLWGSWWSWFVAKTNDVGTVTTPPTTTITDVMIPVGVGTEAGVLGAVSPSETVILIHSNATYLRAVLRRADCCR